jgi:hypothetical protein
MAKVPDSSKSESWTARIPNDLADSARDKALSLGMLKLGGKPNTTLIIHAALRSWLELPNDISNSVSNNTSNDLSNDVIQILESRLDELTNAISNTVKRDELDTFKTEILEDVELMIAASVNTQAVVNHAIANLKTEQLQVELPVITAIATKVPEIKKEPVVQLNELVSDITAGQILNKEQAKQYALRTEPKGKEAVTRNFSDWLREGRYTPLKFKSYGLEYLDKDQYRVLSYASSPVSRL